MRNQVRKYVVGFSLVVVLSIAAPAMAATADGGDGSDGILSRLITAVIQMLDVVENKGTLPPG
jgi:heme/copper-type cytochrome/quinol oxidase subunit 4